MNYEQRAMLVHRNFNEGGSDQLCQIMQNKPKQTQFQGAYYENLSIGYFNDEKRVGEDV